MQPLVSRKGKAILIDRVNIDTDQIIPKQFLKRIERTGFGDVLFFDWRFRPDGSVDESFELNQAVAEGAQILVAGDNFGCGSSREHAVWALRDYGFDIVIAPSFADIFFNNCFKNGVLPIALPMEKMKLLLSQMTGNGTTELEVDVRSATITLQNGESISFEIDAHRQTRLLEGLDDIGITLKVADAISEYEENQRVAYQFVY